MKRKLPFNEQGRESVIRISHAVLLSILLVGPCNAEEKAKRKFFDEQDGYLDLSEFLEHPMGFIPMVIPITEPAIGYGGAFAPVFIRPGNKTPTGETERPQIWAAGGMRTENGTEGLFGMYKATWGGNRLETLIAGVSASVNLDFHGIGDDRLFGGDPMQYNLDAVGGLAHARYRVGESDWWLGARYMRAQVDASYVRPPGFPDYIPERSFTTDVGGVSLLINHDTFNNVFSPTKGHLWEFNINLYDPAFGADGTWQIWDAVAIHYWPVGESVTLALKTDVHAATGDAPFFMLPFVQLRGVSAMSIQGDVIASAELEARWQFHPRFSILGFAGAGAAWRDTNRLEDIATTVSGGVGFRYLISRRYGLQMGIDVAKAENEDPALYLQFGSAWPRL